MRDLEIYQNIGQKMLLALPEQWSVAWIDVMVRSSRSITTHERYLEVDQETVESFDINAPGYSGTTKLFIELRELMQEQTPSSDWNKMRFIVHPDGDFEVDFKTDPDLNWLNSLNPDKDIYPDSDTIQAIRSWDGLGEDVYRPWLDPESAMYKG